MDDLLNALLHAAIVAAVPAIYFLGCLIVFWVKGLIRNRNIRRHRAYLLAHMARRTHDPS